jgi:hypothetical protein
VTTTIPRRQRTNQAIQSPRIRIMLGARWQKPWVAPQQNHWNELGLRVRRLGSLRRQGLQLNVPTNKCSNVFSLYKKILSEVLHHRIAGALDLLPAKLSVQDYQDAYIQSADWLTSGRFFTPAKTRSLRSSYLNLFKGRSIPAMKRREEIRETRCLS